LFDGKTSDEWRGAYKNTFPQKGWEVKDDSLNVLASPVANQQMEVTQRLLCRRFLQQRWS
jgi:hypothetical protein